MLSDRLNLDKQILTALKLIIIYPVKFSTNSPNNRSFNMTI